MMDWVASMNGAAALLHSLDPLGVAAAIADIMVDLLGAKRCVLLMANPQRPRMYDAIELVQGSLGTGAFASTIYAGGDALVDRCLVEGRMRLGPTLESRTVAAVPLVVRGEIVGALVLLELLSHKRPLQCEDRELLELLAAHAASALVAARLFQDTQRKLDTLQGLVATMRHAPGLAR